MFQGSVCFLGSAALADAICGDLREHYTRTVTDIVTELIANFTSSHVVEDLAQNLADDPDVATELGKLIHIIAEAGI